MSTPVFSIITVCFNSGKTIARTIESVLCQEYIDYEYIIIDGGSTDSTLAVIESYEEAFDGRLRFISEKDSGIYNAMNKGIDMACGEYVALLNSDDWYETNTLEVVSRHTSHKHDVIYGLSKYWNDGIPQMILARYPEIKTLSVPPHPTSFIRNDVYRTHGHYDESYKSAADLDFFLRLCSRNVSFFLIESTLANFSQGGMSYTQTGQIETLIIKKLYGIISSQQCEHEISALTHPGFPYKLLRKTRKLFRHFSFTREGRWALTTATRDRPDSLAS